MDNYISEAKKIIRDIFFEPSMTEEEWFAFELAFMLKTGLTYEKLSDQIAEGVKNGHSLDFQTNLIMGLFKNHN